MSKLIKCDYGKVETRILNDINKPQLINMNKDIYRIKASEMFNVEVNNITEEQRNIAKTELYRSLYNCKKA
jgi:DNA polymerase I-like protein with 3'-5' exonuclease and polymerase domains